jgi:hypothetical protein
MLRCKRRLIYVYMYIYVYREREREREQPMTKVGCSLSSLSQLFSLLALSTCGKLGTVSIVK